MIDTAVFYPNKDSLTDENGKEFKYAYKGKGYNNKRDINKDKVGEYLNNPTQLDKLFAQALERTKVIFQETGESKEEPSLRVGFLNKNTHDVHHDLGYIVSAMRHGHLIKVIVYRNMFGKPMEINGFYISEKSLTGEGKEIAGSKLNYYLDSIKEDGTFVAYYGDDLEPSESNIFIRPFINSAPPKDADKDSRIFISPDPLA